MKKSFYLLSALLLIIIFSQSIQAQGKRDILFDPSFFPDMKRKDLKEMTERIQEGDNYFKLGFPAAYSEAIDIYIPAYNFNPDNATLNYKMGVSYLYTGHHNEALNHLKKAYSLRSNVNPDILLVLGEAYHQNLSLDTALMYYLDYVKVAENKAYVLEQIAACERAKSLVKNPVNVFIDNLGPGTNTSWPEYSPVINADESIMFFTSSRPETKGGLRSPNDLLFFEDVYYSVRSGTGWKQARQAEDPINTELHDATVGLSIDGTKLFIYRGDNGGDLYVSELDGFRWSEPEPLKGNINTSAQESSASFSPDGRTIYFTSDRKGGFGGSDIYKAQETNRGKWTHIENLGPVINTGGDEMGVFMHPDGKTLYFSSTRHTTMGGFDIFFSVWDGTEWSQPTNIGFPINTPDDELFMVMSASGLHGYFASNRKGGMGDNDIYKVHFLGADKPVIDDAEDIPLAGTNLALRQPEIEAPLEVSVSELTLVKGRVLDAFTQDAIEATFELVDNATGDLVAEFKSNAGTGKYLITLPSGKDYGLFVSAIDYLFHSENFNIPITQGFQEITKDIYLFQPEVGQSIVLRNIFFDFDKASIRRESRVELNRLLKLLKDYPTMYIEISGHTDNVGTSEYNKKLSTERAKSVVQYLVDNGIPRNRMEYVGYGFDKPISDNDTPYGRQQNRRTEFKILEQ